MGRAQNAASREYLCWDCKEKIEVENGILKNGKFLVYENGKKKLRIFKCCKCFEKNKELKNFQECEVYSRIVGYLRPVQNWNVAKRNEFQKRKEYKIKVKT